MREKEFVIQFGRPDALPPHEEMPGFNPEEQFLLADAGYVTLQVQKPEGGYACAVDPHKLVIAMDTQTVTRRSVRETIRTFTRETEKSLPIHLQRSPGIRVGNAAETNLMIETLGKNNYYVGGLREMPLLVRGNTRGPFDVMTMTQFPSDRRTHPLDWVSSTSIADVNVARAEGITDFYLMPMIFSGQRPK